MATNITRRTFLDASTKAVSAVAGSSTPVKALANLAGVFQGRHSIETGRIARLSDNAWNRFRRKFSYDAPFANRTGAELEGEVQTQVVGSLPAVVQSASEFCKLKLAVADKSEDQALIIGLSHQAIEMKKRFYASELRKLAIFYPDSDPRFERHSWEVNKDEYDTQTIVDELRHAKAWATSGSVDDFYRIYSLWGLENIKTKYSDFFDLSYEAGYIDPAFEQTLAVGVSNLNISIEGILRATGISLDLINALTDIHPDYIAKFNFSDLPEFVDYFFDDKRFLDQIAGNIREHMAGVAYSFVRRQDRICSRENLEYMKYALQAEVQDVYLRSVGRFFPHINIVDILVPRISKGEMRGLVSTGMHQLRNLSVIEGGAVEGESSPLSSQAQRAVMASTSADTSASTLDVTNKGIKDAISEAVSENHAPDFVAPQRTVTTGFVENNSTNADTIRPS